MALLIDSIQSGVYLTQEQFSINITCVHSAYLGMHPELYLSHLGNGLTGRTADLTPLHTAVELYLDYLQPSNSTPRHMPFYNQETRTLMFSLAKIWKQYEYPLMEKYVPV